MLKGGSEDGEVGRGFCAVVEVLGGERSGEVEGSEELFVLRRSRTQDLVKTEKKPRKLFSERKSKDQEEERDTEKGRGKGKSEGELQAEFHP